MREITSYAFLIPMLLLAASLLTCAAGAASAKQRVAVLKDAFPYSSAVFVDRLIESLGTTGAPTVVSGTELARLLASEPRKVDALVLPDARFFPAQALDDLQRYLKQGGNLLAIGGPAFSKLMVERSGKWTEAKKAAAPVLESLSPPYKTFELRSAARLEAYGNQTVFGPEARQTAPASMVCPFWRPRGLGAQEKTDYRWIPLISTFDSSGEFRGTPVSLMLNVDNEYAGSVWGSVGITDPDFLDKHSRYVTGLARTLLHRMASGAFLQSAGVEHLCYVTGEKITVGARAAEVGQERITAARMTIKQGGRTFFDETWPTSGRIPTSKEIESLSLRPGYYTVETRLLAGEEVIDLISYQFSVVDANRKLGPDLVTVKDGDFYLKGKKWYPIGINFWPLYCTAHETHGFRNISWQSPEQYDPEWIDLDLDQLVSLGMNSVSIQFPGKGCVRPVMDFLERCRDRGVKVNISVSGHAISGDPESAAWLIREARFTENDTVYTYDLAWEPHLGAEKERKVLDYRWRRWIEDRYGSVANAEKDWEFKTTDAKGRVHGPTDKQVTSEGPWARMVAAYRRFADDIISKGYGRSVRVIRKVDPNHLFGVRTGYGGTGQLAIAHRFPYDLISGVKHLDYTSPEGYGLGGEYRNYRRAGFLNTYGRFVSGGRPVFWAEYGVPHYFQGNYRDHSQEKQTHYFANMHRMFVETDVSGGAGWWWPGGHRVDEDSDFGIINPDRSPRPAAIEVQKVIEAYRKNPPERKPADYWIEIDRDLHPSGLPMVWTGNTEEYLRAFDEGKSVGLRTKGTGTDSSNTPMIAVGNTPINGHNPPKYLNAEFNWLQVVDVSGKWVEVLDGSVVEVAAGPIRARASVGNIAESTWLTPAEAGPGNGGVYLCAGDGETALPVRTAYLADAEFAEFTIDGVTGKAAMALWMLAENRSPFGEKLRFTLKPVRRSKGGK